jgi:hypothetical protein
MRGGFQGVSDRARHLLDYFNAQNGFVYRSKRSEMGEALNHKNDLKGSYSHEFQRRLSGDSPVETRKTINKLELLAIGLLEIFGLFKI